MRATEVGVGSTEGLRRMLTAMVLVVLIGAVGAHVVPMRSSAQVDLDVEVAGSVAPVLDAAPHRTLRAHSSRRVVVLYGDSLAWEARRYFAAAFDRRPDVEVITRTFGGTAICDWLETMRADAAELAPVSVVVEFSGNAITRCMLDEDDRPLSGAAYLQKYRADAAAVVEVFRPGGTRVYFVGAPGPRSPGDAGGSRGQLDPTYRELVATWPDGVEFVDAGAAVLDDGRWTRTLPCLSGEPCEGGTDPSGVPVNVVRAPDGNHFCPLGEGAVSGVTGECRVWSSGAYRFAHAMAQPVIVALEG